MRKSLRVVPILLGAVLLANIVNAQDRFAYAVTDVQTEGSNWSFLRKLNLQNGEYSPVLLNGDDASFIAYDASTKKLISTPLLDSRYGSIVNAAFGTGVAAAAYDAKNNRLYYTPMMVDQLRFIDLKTMKVYYVTDQGLTGTSLKSSDQGNIVTRMVIASDGNGYAMTNDATQFIQFTTGKKPKITELGSLVDDPSNKGTSIHNSCSSYGGDIIADDNGNLYIFSARNHVFKVNIETRVATHLGSITGLPANFTANGAVVDENNHIVVSSAVQGTIPLFVVDPKTWAATELKTTGQIWHSSDLANGNVLITNKSTKNTTPEIVTRVTPVGQDASKIQIFPNPVTNNQFAIQFNQLDAGNYSVQLTDVTGRQIMQQQVTISGDGQVQNINVNPSVARGVYLVKVVDNNSKSIFSSKLILQ